MRTLPFTIDDLNGGFMKAEGILRVEKQKLLFEFQKKDDILEVYKSDISYATIPISELSLIEFKKGVFSSKLILHATTGKVFEDLPGKEFTERTLKIKRKNRELAASLASKVNLMLSEQRLKELEGDQE